MKYLPDGKPLKDDMLREALNNITLSLKRILSQLVCLGSTQSNENFNNMVASKAPKNRAYGGTTSLASRVSAAVLQKNEGYTYISQTPFFHLGLSLNCMALEWTRRNYGTKSNSHPLLSKEDDFC